MAKSKNIAEKIISDKELESHALQAKSFLQEYDMLMVKIMALQKAVGSQPQEPTNFCRNLILQYGLKKLESNIIQV